MASSSKVPKSFAASGMKRKVISESDLFGEILDTLAKKPKIEKTKTSQTSRKLPSISKDVKESSSNPKDGKNKESSSNPRDGKNKESSSKPTDMKNKESSSKSKASNDKKYSMKSKDNDAKPSSKFIDGTDRKSSSSKSNEPTSSRKSSSSNVTKSYSSYSFSEKSSTSSFSDKSSSTKPSNEALFRRPSNKFNSMSDLSKSSDKKFTSDLTKKFDTSDLPGKTSSKSLRRSSTSISIDKSLEKKSTSDLTNKYDKTNSYRESSSNSLRRSSSSISISKSSDKKSTPDLTNKSDATNSYRESSSNSLRRSSTSISISKSSDRTYASDLTKKSDTANSYRESSSSSFRRSSISISKPSETNLPSKSIDKRSSSKSSEHSFSNKASETNSYNKSSSKDSFSKSSESDLSSKSLKPDSYSKSSGKSSSSKFSESRSSRKSLDNNSSKKSLDNNSSRKTLDNNSSNKSLDNNTSSKSLEYSFSNKSLEANSHGKSSGKSSSGKSLETSSSSKSSRKSSSSKVSESSNSGKTTGKSSSSVSSGKCSLDLSDKNNSLSKSEPFISEKPFISSDFDESPRSLSQPQSSPLEKPFVKNISVNSPRSLNKHSSPNFELSRETALNDSDSELFKKPTPITSFCNSESFIKPISADFFDNSEFSIMPLSMNSLYDFESSKKFKPSHSTLNKSKIKSPLNKPNLSLSMKTSAKKLVTKKCSDLSSRDQTIKREKKVKQLYLDLFDGEDKASKKTEETNEKPKGNDSKKSEEKDYASQLVQLFRKGSGKETNKETLPTSPENERLKKIEKKYQDLSLDQKLMLLYKNHPSPQSDSGRGSVSSSDNRTPPLTAQEAAVPSQTLNTISNDISFQAEIPLQFVEQELLEIPEPKNPADLAKLFPNMMAVKETEEKSKKKPAVRSQPSLWMKGSSYCPKRRDATVRDTLAANPPKLKDIPIIEPHRLNGRNIPNKPIKPMKPNKPKKPSFLATLRKKMLPPGRIIPTGSKLERNPQPPRNLPMTKARESLSQKVKEPMSMPSFEFPNPMRMAVKKAEGSLSQQSASKQSTLTDSDSDEEDFQFGSKNACPRKRPIKRGERNLSQAYQSKTVDALPKTQEIGQGFNMEKPRPTFTALPSEETKNNKSVHKNWETGKPSLMKRVAPRQETLSDSDSDDEDFQFGSKNPCSRKRPMKRGERNQSSSSLSKPANSMPKTQKMGQEFNMEKPKPTLTTFPSGQTKMVKPLNKIQESGKPSLIKMATSKQETLSGSDSDEEDFPLGLKNPCPRKRPIKRGDRSLSQASLSKTINTLPKTEDINEGFTLPQPMNSILPKEEIEKVELTKKNWESGKLGLLWTAAPKQESLSDSESDDEDFIIPRLEIPPMVERLSPSPPPVEETPLSDDDSSSDSSSSESSSSDSSSAESSSSDSSDDDFESA